jgi:hypothetical protein
MNAIQPRLMQEAVGIHPIVVLGRAHRLKVGGIIGAISGSRSRRSLAFFFHYPPEPGPRGRGGQTARRVEEREAHDQGPRDPRRGHVEVEIWPGQIGR